MKRASLLVPALALLACGGPLRDTGVLRPENRPYVGDLAFLDAQGHRHTLKDYAGRVLLVDLWATWCPPCRESLPEVAALQRQGGADRAVLAISVDKEGFGDVIPFQKAHPGLALEAMVPAGPGSLRPIGALDAIPTTLVVDRRGRLRERWMGYQAGRAARALDAAAKEL